MFTKRLLSLGLSASCLAALGIAVSPADARPGGGPPKSTVDTCGTAIYKTTGEQWQCTFADDFDGRSLDDQKWSPLLTKYTGGVKADCRVDNGTTIRTGGGTLKLTVHDTGKEFLCESASGDYYTRYAAGAVSTGKKFSQAFGRFEIRAAMTDARVAGLHSGIWMWPQERRYGSLSGEIDINEYRTALPDYPVPTVHYTDDGTAGKKSKWNCYVENPETFHTYTLEWTSTTLTFLYDGKVCFSHEWQPADPLVKPQPFDEPYYLILNQNLGGGGNAFDPATTPLPATMEVDYVRVWR